MTDAVLNRDQLLEIAAQVLEQGRDAIDPSRPLGGQGMDSLRMVELFATLDEQFDVCLALADLPLDVSIDDLLQLSTHAEAGQRLTARMVDGELAHTSIDDGVPLTPMQQAYWRGRSSNLELGGLAMHGYLELEHEAELCPERLSLAWACLLRRHPMLRAEISSEGRLHIRPEGTQFELECLDWQMLSSSQCEARLATLRRQREHALPDLVATGPCRLTLVRLPEARSRLLVSLDGSCLDIRSMQVLLDELAQYYLNPDAVLPSLPLDFATVAVHRARRHRGMVPVPLGLPPAPELPLQRQPRAIKRPLIRRKQCMVSALQLQQLHHLAQGLQASLPAVLMTAFAEIIATWSRSPRFLLNVPSYNRHGLGAEGNVHGIVGCFSSVAVLAVDLSRFESFEDRLRRMQASLSAALDPQRPDGVLLLRELARRSGQPLANPAPVVFTCAPMPRRGESSWTMVESTLGAIIYRASQTPQTWLDCQIWPYRDQLVVSWDYVDGLFPDGMVDDMFRSFTERLRSLAEDEALRRQRAPDLRPAWQIESVTRLNATATPGMPTNLLFEVQRQVRHAPDALAVVCGDQRMGYAELWAAAGQLATRLQRNGCGDAMPIALELDYDAHWVLAILGCLRAGCAWLPLDRSWPPLRMQRLVEIAGASRRIVEGKGRYGLRVRRVGGSMDTAKDMPRDLAYIMFTSGSTGAPKGVLMSHAAAANTVMDVNQRFSLSADDVWLGLADASFDLSVYDVFGALFAGGRLVLPRPAMRRDALEWAALIESEGVTVLNVVPQMGEMLAAVGERQSRQWPSLRLILISGDWIPPGLPQRLRRLCPAAKVVGLGGATEAGIWSICQPVSEQWSADRRIPYGRPMANQTVHVVKQDGMPAPFHVPGEIRIGGCGLADGYAGDAEATAVAFEHDLRSGQRFYRTGDIGRHMADGTLELIGREDLRIKLRGYRIDPAEIEAAMLTLDGVKDAVAMVCHADSGRELLVCFLLMEGEADIDPARCHEHARSRLPMHMVPSDFRGLSAWPLTANGKVDRAALQREADGWSKQVTVYEAPANAMERQLQVIVHQVSGLDRVGVNDDLLALGLSSIVAVQIQVRIGEAIGRDVGGIDLFQYNSIRRIAAWLDADVG